MQTDTSSMEIKNTPLLFQQQLNQYYKDILNCEIVKPTYWAGKVPETFFLRKRKSISEYKDWGGEEVLDYTTFGGEEYAITRSGKEIKVKKWYENLQDKDVSKIDNTDRIANLQTVFNEAVTENKPSSLIVDDFQFNDSGTKLFIFTFDYSDMNNATLYVGEYLLSGRYDITKIYNDGVTYHKYKLPMESGLEGHTCNKVCIGDDGKFVVFSSRYGTKRLYTIRLTTPFSFTGTEDISTVDMTNGVNEDIYALKIGTTGKNIYTVNGTSIVRQFVLSAEGNINPSATKTDVTLYDKSGNALAFKGFATYGLDGMKCYATSGNTIYQYNLGTKDDLTTVQKDSGKANAFSSITISNLSSTDGIKLRLSQSGMYFFPMQNGTTTLYEFVLPHYRQLYKGKYRDDCNISFKRGFQNAKGVCLLGEDGESRVVGMYENTRYKLFPVQNIKTTVSADVDWTDIKSTTSHTCTIVAPATTPVSNTNSRVIIKSHDGGNSLIGEWSLSGTTLTVKNITSIDSTNTNKETGVKATIKKGSQVFFSDGEKLKSVNGYAGCYMYVTGGANDLSTVSANVTKTLTKTSNELTVSLASVKGIAADDSIKLYKLESGTDKGNNILGTIKSISGNSVTITVLTVDDAALTSTGVEVTIKSGQQSNCYNTRDGTSAGCVFQLDANTLSYASTKGGWDVGGIPNYSTYKIFTSYGEVLSFIGGDGLYVIHGSTGYSWDYSKYESLIGDGTGYVIDAEWYDRRIFALQSNHNVMVGATEMGGGNYPLDGGYYGGYFNHSSLIGNVLNGMRVVPFNNTVLIFTKEEIHVIKSETLKKGDYEFKNYPLTLAFDFMGLHSMHSVCSYNTGVYLLNDKNSFITLNLDETYFNRYKFTTEDMGIDIQQWLDGVGKDDKVTVGINSEEIYISWDKGDNKGSTVFIYDEFYSFRHRRETDISIKHMHVSSDVTYLGDTTYRYGLDTAKYDDTDVKKEYTQHLRRFTGESDIFSLKTILYHELYLGAGTDLSTVVKYKARLSDGMFEYKIPLKTASYLQKTSNLRGGKALGSQILGYQTLGGQAENALIGTFVSDVDVLEIPLGFPYTLLEITVEGDFETGGNIMGGLVHDCHLTPYEDVVPYLDDN